MAQAVRFHTAGGPEVLTLEDVDVGLPGPGEVRIRHHAILETKPADQRRDSAVLGNGITRLECRGVAEAHRAWKPAEKTQGSDGGTVETGVGETDDGRRIQGARRIAIHPTETGETGQRGGHRRVGG